MRGVKPSNIVPGKIAGVPKPPAWLSKDAKAEWKRVAAILVERNVLTDADLGTLESYCTATGLIRECQREINSKGLTIIGPKGPMRNPAINAQNAAITQARLLANELGLTPVSRSRPAIRDDNDEDDASDLGL